MLATSKYFSCDYHSRRRPIDERIVQNRFARRFLSIRSRGSTVPGEKSPCGASVLQIAPGQT